VKSSLDFSRFRVITFDCYGTLVDWETGILSALRPILSAHGATLESAEILRLYGDLEAHAEGSEYRPYREVLRALHPLNAGLWDQGSNAAAASRAG